MRPVTRTGRILALAGLAVGLALLILWAWGGFDRLALWASTQQREAQRLMAGALRGLKAGEPGATLGLLAICFGYGVAHAAGPGHGKVLIGGYGFGTRVPFARLAAISVVASVAQSLTAVALVAGGIAVLNLSRETLTDLTERHLADLGTGMIGLVGLWLAWRGLRQVMQAGRAAGHDHHHHHHGDACGCGHAHGPSPDQIAHVHSLRDALALILGIAARPCTGALFLLILTWRMGIFATGIAGAVAMGLGVATVTLAVAGMAVWARQGSLALVPPGPGWAAVARWLPGLMQLGAGLLIALVCARMLF